MKTLRAFFAIIAVSIFAVNISAQTNHRFTGYSFELKADDSANCAMRFISTGGRNSIKIFEAGTNRSVPARGITGCNQSRVQANLASPNGQDFTWCFEGPEELYEIAFDDGNNYLWPAESKESGFYNLKDFLPVKRSADPKNKFEAIEPADYTHTIQNALSYIASHSGGTLNIPNGDYIVGTLDGNTRDPKYDGITVPPGVNIIGASGLASEPNTNLPNRKGATRIRLRNNNQAIFRVGNCTNHVSFRKIELLSNVALYGEAKRDQTGTYGIEVRGNLPAGSSANTNDVVFTFEDVVFQEFAKGLVAHNANENNCNPAVQMCNAWSLDNFKVDHCSFFNNKIGVEINTFNSEWGILNSIFSYTAANAPGVGISIVRAGTVLVQQSFGGGYDYGAGVGGTFINILTVGTLTMVNNSSERALKSIVIHPAGATSQVMLTLVGNVVSDPMDLTGRINFMSTGNLYTARSFGAGSNVKVTSVGDRFCQDPIVAPGNCVTAAGAKDRNPNYGNARVMFATGAEPEGKGVDILQRRPNYFGYDVELANGLMQYDPNITFDDITKFAVSDPGGNRVKDGALVYCKDCRKDSSGVCTQGRAGSDGAFAKRINGKWRCD